MKTLGKSITQAFYKNENGFAVLKDRWKELVIADQINKRTQKRLLDEHSRTGEFKPFSAALKIERLTGFDHLLYAILRGKDYTKGFENGNSLLLKYYKNRLKHSTNRSLPNWAKLDVLNVDAIVGFLQTCSFDGEPYCLPTELKEAA